MIGESRVLTARMGNENSHTLEAARAAGAYSICEKAYAMTPEEVIGVVKDSGLRGRGGAGFPCGL